MFSFQKIKGDITSWPPKPWVWGGVIGIINGMIVLLSLWNVNVDWLWLPYPIEVALVLSPWIIKLTVAVLLFGNELEPWDMYATAILLPVFWGWFFQSLFAKGLKKLPAAIFIVAGILMFWWLRVSFV